MDEDDLALVRITHFLENKAGKFRGMRLIKHRERERFVFPHVYYNYALMGRSWSITYTVQYEKTQSGVTAVLLSPMIYGDREALEEDFVLLKMAI